MIDFDREVRYSLQQLCSITTLESDAKRMDKGSAVVILGTTSLRSLVLGWAVGLRSKASRHGAFLWDRSSSVWLCSVPALSRL